jgi:hypothetical protein
LIGQARQPGLREITAAVIGALPRPGQHLTGAARQAPGRRRD